MSVGTAEPAPRTESLAADPGAPPWALIAGLLSVVGLAERYSNLYQRNVVDDAMTSMQYAKQLALGHGLVFNVGERVEGYTNFAWVLFMAPIYKLSTWFKFDFVHAVVQCNIAIAAAVLALVYLLARRRYGANHLATWLAVGLCAVDNAFSVWAVLGLEVHLLALFMLLALWALGRPSRSSWLWVGLALLGAHLTRPDAGLFCVTLLGNELLESALEWRRKQPELARRRAASTAGAMAVYLVGYGSYFLWRYHYFGQLLPNTYYLKLGGDIDAWARGLEYLRTFLDQRAFVPLLALLSVLALREPIVRALFIYNVLHAAYVVYVGGDFFAGHRFFVPEIPQLALLAGAGIAEAWTRLKRPTILQMLEQREITLDLVRGAALALSACLLIVVFQRGLVLGPLVDEVLAWHDNLTRQTKLFKWLGEHKEPNSSIATCLIGHTGFYSEARVIDICGVIDPVTAHMKVASFGKGKAGHEKIASTAYVLAQNPTYIALKMLGDDLWRRGYFLRGDVPEGTFEGLWQRDPLLTTGQFLPQTRIGFESASASWTATGDAFESWPSHGHGLGQGDLLGTSGGFINTFHPSLGDAATGTLTSPPFELIGDQLLFRIAGGNDPEHLHVDLIIDGVTVQTTTGRQGDILSRRAWDITPYRGKFATFRIVDEAKGVWGYLAVDELVQWRR